jgi:Transglutaminase-like superfamily
MRYLVFKSYLLLLRMDFTLKWRGFKHLYESVREQPTQHKLAHVRIPYEQLCHAMDLACVFYPRTVLCLQRSAAAVYLLRGSGWPAQFVTGCTFKTLENHAWVEIDGKVVNDKPYTNEIYQELDRC